MLFIHFSNCNISDQLLDVNIEKIAGLEKESVNFLLEILKGKAIFWLSVGALKIL